MPVIQIDDDKAPQGFGIIRAEAWPNMWMKRQGVGSPVYMPTEPLLPERLATEFYLYS